MGKHIILERLGTILTPIKHLLDKLEANKVDRSELDEALESKVNKDELDEIISDTISSNPNIKNKMDKDNPVGTGSFSMNRRSNSTIGLCSTTIGNHNDASGKYSFAEGYNTAAEGLGAHSEGDGSRASGDYSHAEGRSLASGKYSHAEGLSTQANMRSQHVHGEFNDLDPLYKTGSYKHDVRGKYIHIVGNGTAIDQRSNAHTLDWDGNAWFAGSIKVGGTGQDDANAQKIALKGDYLSEFTNDIGYITAKEVSLAYPTKNEISSTYATIGKVRQEIEDLVDAAPETLNTLGELANAFQEHEDIVISVQDAILNKMDKSNPKGAGSFSLNRKVNTAIGSNSSVLGQDNTASGAYSFASGLNTTAKGNASHSEGTETISVGAHAEGNYSIALGLSSHAEGYGSYNSLKVYIPANSSTCTIVSRASGGTPGVNVGDIVYYNGIYAFVNEMPDSSTLILSRALSYNSEINDTLVFTKTIAFGSGSHVEGYNSIALGSYSHVEGQNNISDTTGNLAHILGNGSYPTNRSNAHTIDWDGNAWFSGDVYTGSTSGKNKDGGSKKLATENYVNEKVGAISIPKTLSELTSDATHRTVTDTEKASWNAKSNFSGSYNDLTNKPTIPSKVSDLNNDANYATQNDVIAPKSELILIDKITGENYIVCIENGNLVSYKAE